MFEDTKGVIRRHISKKHWPWDKTTTKGKRTMGNKTLHRKLKLKLKLSEPN
jgi:hypothetical protein